MGTNMGRSHQPETANSRLSNLVWGSLEMPNSPTRAVKNGATGTIKLLIYHSFTQTPVDPPG
jgi:hypothetical protein